MSERVTVSAKDERRLHAEEIVWLTTVGASGAPRPVPVWFYWDGATFLIYSQPNKPKLRNIERNPLVALNLNCTPTGSDVVIIDGLARIDPTAPTATELPAYLEKYRRGIAELFSEPAGFATEYSVAIRVTPTKVTSPY